MFGFSFFSEMQVDSHFCFKRLFISYILYQLTLSYSSGLNFGIAVLQLGISITTLMLL